MTVHDQPHIGLVVEGAGDRDAIPLLLRKHLADQEIFTDVLGKPITCHGRGNATIPGGIEGYVATAAARPGCRAVLVILDGDDDPVCKLGPSLIERARSVARVPVAVSLAEACFEDWLYASAETLEIGLDNYHADRRGLLEVKAALGKTKYIKPVWQPRLTARIDLQQARTRNRSLDRMLRRFDNLRCCL
jgi:hypothetical protein